MDYVKKIFDILTIDQNDPLKWVKYYELETSKYYEYLIDYLPTNKKILEVGSGGGVFYSQYQDKLVSLNNQYTCIDIDEPSIRFSQQNCDYVNFSVRDICQLSEEELKQYDVLIFVQSYMVIPGAKDVLKKYLTANPNGRVMLVYTAFPDQLIKVVDVIRDKILSKQKFSFGRTMSLSEISDLSLYLDKPSVSLNMCKSLAGFDEYLTIIN